MTLRSYLDWWKEKFLLVKRRFVPDRLKPTYRPPTLAEMTAANEEEPDEAQQPRFGSVTKTVMLGGSTRQEYYRSNYLQIPQGFSRDPALPIPLTKWIARGDRWFCPRGHVLAGWGVVPGVPCPIPYCYTCSLSKEE